MRWEVMNAREAGKIADKAIEYLHSTGVVKEAYYRIYNDHYPIIYAQLAIPPLEGIRIVIRDEATAEIIARMEASES